MVKCQGGVIYVQDMFYGVVWEMFESKVEDVVGTGGFVSQTFDVISDLCLRYFNFLIRTSC